MLPNLFICLTPLQAWITLQLIKQTAPFPAHCVMMTYLEANNAKFQHYYQCLKQHSAWAKSYIIPSTAWKRWCNLRVLRTQLASHYHTVFVASVDNAHIRYLASHLSFEYLETFDDGTGNLYPDSVLYGQHTNLKRIIINQLLGMRYDTIDLRHLSRQHHTLYPNVPNIVTPTVPIQLWNHQKPSIPYTQTIRILLGQPLLKHIAQNQKLFETISSHINPDVYFPHPRENYSIPNVSYIHTPLIFEDYLFEQIKNNPSTQFEIYHIASTAALNVAHFHAVKIYTLRPNLPIFNEKRFTDLYNIMKKMGMNIVDKL